MVFIKPLTRITRFITVNAFYEAKKLFVFIFYIIALFCISKLCFLILRIPNQSAPRHKTGPCSVITPLGSQDNFCER
jgi:hypothetical protein